jgi:hypothetical protein
MTLRTDHDHPTRRVMAPRGDDNHGRSVIAVVVRTRVAVIIGTTDHDFAVKVRITEAE